MKGPDFIGIGAQKAATTWIYDILKDHPEVALSEQKELDFFSRWFDQGYQWYEHQLGNESNDKLSGELSPSYLNEPAVPARVAAYVPNAKIIVSLREPVSRAISNHKHEVRVGHLTGDDLSFEYGLANNPSYFDQGCYATHLSNWLKYFPREQMLILLHDDIVADPAGVAKQVYAFLGIDDAFVSVALHEFSNISHLKRSPGLDSLRRSIRLKLVALGVGGVWEAAAKMGLRKLYRSAAWVESEASVPPISNEIKAELRERFRTETEALEGMIGRSLAHWKDPEVKAEEIASFPEKTAVAAGN